MTQKNTKKILTISLAAIFGIAMIVSPIGAEAMGSFLDVKKAKVVTDSSELEKAKFDTKSNIPTDGLSGAFGYGVIFATETDTVVAVTTTHSGVQDSIAQSDANDPVFHNHYVTLIDDVEDAKCPGLQVENITFQEPGDVDVNKKKASMEDIPYYFAGTHSLTNAPITINVDENIAAAVSFTINPVDGTGSTSVTDIQAVCINDVAFAGKLQVKEKND